MQQSSEPWRSQEEFSSLDSHISYDSDMPDSQSSQEETNSQSSQEETDRLSSQMETDRLSSQMETDRLSSGETAKLSSGETAKLSSGMKDSPEIKASQAVSVPVLPNTAMIPKTRRISRSLEHIPVKVYVLPVTKLFYKQRLGSETSTMEFKRGLGDPPKSLKINTGEFKGTFVDNLRKYATAFLNNEGGKLMFGVDDSGQVLGNKIRFIQRDKYHQTADSVFMNFKPRVWPGNYHVEFVPVVAGVEEMPPGETPDLKDLMVLCITFKRPAGCRELYRTEQGKAFIRGDGSVQQMTTDAIHDWYKQKWTDEVEQLAKERKKEKYEQKRVIVDLQTKQNSSPTHQKRKRTRAPASEEADKKSPRLGKHGSMEENEDDEDRKVPVRKGMDDLMDKVPVRKGMDDLKDKVPVRKGMDDLMDKVPVRKGMDDLVLMDKTWSEEERQKRPRRKQSSQHLRTLFLASGLQASGSSVMKENRASGSSVGERGAEKIRRSDRALI